MTTASGLQQSDLGQIVRVTTTNGITEGRLLAVIPTTDLRGMMPTALIRMRLRDARRRRPNEWRPRAIWEVDVVPDAQVDVVPQANVTSTGLQRPSTVADRLDPSTQARLRQRGAPPSN